MWVTRAMLAQAPAGTVVRLAYTELLAAEGRPKPAAELWKILQKAGVPLLYNPAARALHYHHVTLEQSLERMRTLGRSAVLIKQRVPDFDRVPSGWRLLAYRILSCFPDMAGKHRRAFLEGIVGPR
jgi:hypothetical protein